MPSSRWSSLAAALGIGTHPGGLPDRDVALARRLIAAGAVVLDVRTPAEHAAGHLEGATLIPVQQLPSRLAEVEALTGGDKARPIVVHCASGARSATAKQVLLKAGYTQVTNAGGFAALRGDR